MYSLSSQCSGSVLVNISLRGGAILHYVWVSSTVNCQPFVCLSIHLIANNHYPALSSWQMINVVLKSDGWPCHSDVQACIKNHLYEMPVSVMKSHTQYRMCMRMLTDADKRRKWKDWGKDSTLQQETEDLPYSCAYFYNITGPMVWLVDSNTWGRQYKYHLRCIFPPAALFPCFPPSNTETAPHYPLVFRLKCTAPQSLISLDLMTQILSSLNIFLQR